MYGTFTGGTCHCSFTMCQCYAQTTGIVKGVTFYTSSTVLPPMELPKSNPQHYSQFNNGAYGSRRKKR